MVSRRLLALLLVASSGCIAVAGCSAETDDDTATDDGADDGIPGDGSSEDEVVGERQLNGSELPAKTVSLTFDDGPGPRTQELAEYLASEGIPAAFFINGKNAPGRQKALQAIVDNGHELANHTHNHLQLTSQSSAKVVAEVQLTDDVIKQYQPRGPWFIRAPFGAWNGSVARSINNSAMSKYVGSIFWNEGGALTSNAAADWDCWGKGVSVQRCGDLYLQEIKRNGKGIVLFHDIHGKTVDMMKQVVVPGLKAAGFKFARLQDVPSIKRAMGAAGGPPAAANECASATLGRNVKENVCVQSRTDEKWYRCVDGEWARSEAGDARCTARHPL
ncbi:MAG: polysaccharide deacetylase family protein [Labilithrix sp.]|nr:polysaccharide deacetylase family protein [Labilithrix sp.]MCW5814197.1 polysaccharide deacetylase family protein [Labilithrix sp.]